MCKQRAPYGKRSILCTELSLANDLVLIGIHIVLRAFKEVWNQPGMPSQLTHDIIQRKFHAILDRRSRQGRFRKFSFAVLQFEDP